MPSTQPWRACATSCPSCPRGGELGNAQGSGTQFGSPIPQPFWSTSTASTGFSTWPQVGCSKARTELHEAVYLPLSEAEGTLCTLQTRALVANVDTKCLGLLMPVQFSPNSTKLL